jgi:hypothetical protein
MHYRQVYFAVPEKSDNWLRYLTHSLDIPIHLNDIYLCHKIILNGISLALVGRKIVFGD